MNEITEIIGLDQMTVDKHIANNVPLVIRQGITDFSLQSSDLKSDIAEIFYVDDAVYPQKGENWLGKKKSKLTVDRREECFEDFINSIDDPSFLQYFQSNNVWSLKSQFAEPYLFRIPYFRKFRFKPTSLCVFAKGAVTPFHYDPGDNFMVHIRGKKRIDIIPPKFSRNLKLNRFFHGDPRFSSIPNSDIDEFLLENFPLHPMQTVVAGAGDIVYVPSGWFHRVETLVTLTVNVPCWFTPTIKKFFNLQLTRKYINCGILMLLEKHRLE